MSKHTKGPWEAYNGEVTTQRVEGRSFRRIAAIQDYGVAGLPEVDEANAALIAAAPCLLEACKEALPWLVLLGNHIGNGIPGNPDGRCNAIGKIHDALAKAGQDIPNALPETPGFYHGKSQTPMDIYGWKD